MTRPGLLLLAICAFVLAREACAAGTPAGTAVVNEAQVSFIVGGTPATAQSNATTLLVCEVLDVNVTLQSARVSVVAGETMRTLLFMVTNVGNGSEVLPLGIDNLIAGDDFDPQASAPAIYFDSDASGDLSAADTAYVAGSNDPNLAPDGAIPVLLVNDIPAGVSDGQLGRSRLSARAATGTGGPGTTFAGLGAGGTDAVAGASGAQAGATGEYSVGDVQVALVKSATITDPSGGIQPVAGARINYQILVNVSGGGTARAFNIDDAIPANTTYLAGSLRLNGSALTDAADVDGGEFQAGAVPRVRVALGDLTQEAGAQTVAFIVTIN
jgi:uncharacterized repeat protein (TIGR01451 family)